MDANEVSAPAGGFQNPFDVTESCNTISLDLLADGSGTFTCNSSSESFIWKVLNGEFCFEDADASAGETEVCMGYSMDQGGEKFTLSQSYLGQTLSQDFMQSQLSVESVEIPKDFVIYQNYPNPFNPSTTIEFDVAKSANISLAVYDLTGKEIYSLANGYYVAGQYSVVWNATDSNGEDVSSGMYIYQLRTSESVMTKKLVLLR